MKLTIFLLTKVFFIYAFNPDSLATNLNLQKTSKKISIHGRDIFQSRTTTLDMSNSNDDKGGVGNFLTRKNMAFVSALGTIETGYLTYSKLSFTRLLFCDEKGAGCGDVLNGPYSMVHLGNGIDLPLSALGFLAYASVTILLLTDDSQLNRRLLLFLTSSMATFSVFLLYALLVIIQAPCIYCFSSAFLSITLGLYVSLENSTQEKKEALTAMTLTTLASVALFISFPDKKDTMAMVPPEGGYSPPLVTQLSSERSLALAKSLSDLDARMYGAYWCGHCFDQKQAFGKEAMQRYITYIECDNEGKDSQKALCKDKKVPGYPTWDIQGKLVPGEQSLEELEDIVRDARAGMVKK